MICLPDTFLFGSSDLFACLTRMLLFATSAVIIIALLQHFCGITWKTGDGEEITAYYQKLTAGSLCIYTLVYLQQFEKSLMYYCDLGPTCVREVFFN